MTMTDYEPDSSGGYSSNNSESETRRTRRPRGEALPEYRRSVLADGSVRTLVASVVADHIRVLHDQTPNMSAIEAAGAQFVIGQLDAVVDELTGQS